MSRGPWKEHRPRLSPDGNTPTSLLERIAQEYEELAALDSKRAQVNGALSQLFRAARQKEDDPQPASTRVA